MSEGAKMHYNQREAIGEGRATFNPIIEVLTAYAIVHCELDPVRARRWAEIRWIGIAPHVTGMDVEVSHRRANRLAADYGGGA